MRARGARREPAVSRRVVSQKCFVGSSAAKGAMNVSSLCRDPLLSEKSLLRLTRRGGRQERVRADRL